MRLITITLQAGVQVDQPYVGTYFRCLSAVSDFKLKVPDFNVSTDFLSGLGVKFDGRFMGFSLYSDTTQEIKYIVHEGEIDDSRLAGEVDLNGVLKMIQDGASDNSYGAVDVDDTATLIKAANTDRRSILIQAIDEVIYIGSDNTVTTATGIKVDQGGSMEVEHTKAVYAICGAGLNADVRYSEDIN